MKRISKSYMFHLDHQICNVRNLKELELLLGVHSNKLKLLSLFPRYRTFNVKKKDGALRTIEDPDDSLKMVLRLLKLPLQCLYHRLKSPAAHGFVLSYRNDPDKRDIFSNARAHLGCRHLLNIDLSSFFHQVRKPRVEQFFNSSLFKWDKSTAHTLSNLSTYHDRLPMGSPTSPVISNFIAHDLDNELWNFALRTGITYSRFVDDLSFSSRSQITGAHFSEIESICRAHSFSINYTKIKSFGPNEPKTVTGLLLGDGLSLPEEFYDQLELELKALDLLTTVGKTTPDRIGFRAGGKLIQQINGKLNFMKKVNAESEKLSSSFSRKLQDIINERDKDDLTLDWFQLPY